jgi:glycine betaine/proline transport system substrate-binding protein
MKKILMALAAFFLLTMVSCQDQGPKKISILYPNWSEGIAMTHLAKAALEDHGYEVETTLLDPGPIYAALSKKKGDVFLDAWLPNTHKDYWAKYSEDLDVLGAAFTNGTTGLVVPSYVEDVDSISQLNEFKEKFDGKIIGIGSGAGIHANTEKVIEEYGLEFEQVTSSGAAMVASLKKATLSKEPIVITGWKPHFKWAEYELKYLADPKGIYPKDECRIVARKGFKKDFPKVAEFLANFVMEESKLYDLMGVMNEAGDNKDQAAAEWYQKNKDLIGGWFPSDS